MYVVIFATSITMAIMHWETSAYLFYIGIFSYGLALFGYLSRKLRWSNWIGKHILSEIPVLLLWFIPTIVGLPIIYWIGLKYRKPVKKLRNG